MSFQGQRSRSNPWISLISDIETTLFPLDSRLFVVIFNHISYIYIPTGQLCLLSNGNSKERSIQGQRSRSNAWICKHFYLKSRLHVFPLLNGTIVVNFHHIWYIGAYRQGLFVFEQKFRMKVNLRSRSNPYFFFLNQNYFLYWM